MPQFHICHVLPAGRGFHGLNGYREIAESLVWGLQALGHDASYAQNSTRPGAVNIVIGAQMLVEEQLEEVPRGSVIYNLEQLANVPLQNIRPVMRALARRFQIWDYCEANLERWNSFGCMRPPLTVRIGWAPVLERIAKPPRQDIETLIYGTPGGERLEIFRALCHVSLRSIFASGLYGEERDALIARSKIVVNASFYTTSRVFEIARVSYLLANAKAVVSELRPGTIIEPDIRAAVVAATPQTVVERCLELVDDDARRAALEEEGRRIFRARDMREILRPALDELRG